MAYEVARQLRAAGGDVALLAMFEAAPADYGRYTSKDWLASLGRRLRFHLGRLVRLPLRDAIPYARQRLRTLCRNVYSNAWSGAYRTVAGSAETLRGRFQSSDEAVLFALSSYHPEPYPGRIVFFRSADRIDAFKGALDFGWGKLAAGGCEIHVVPGDHISMLEEPHAAELAARLIPYLREPSRSKAA